LRPTLAGVELAWPMLGCWVIEVAEFTPFSLVPSDLGVFVRPGGFYLSYV